MFSKNQLWLKDPNLLTFTNEGNGYPKTPFRLMLDYIALVIILKFLKAKSYYQIQNQFNWDALGKNQF